MSHEEACEWLRIAYGDDVVDDAMDLPAPILQELYPEVFTLGPAASEIEALFCAISRAETSPEMVAPDLITLGASLFRNYDLSSLLGAFREFLVDNIQVFKLLNTFQGKAVLSMEAHGGFDDFDRINIMRGIICAAALLTGQSLATEEARTDVQTHAVIADRVFVTLGLPPLRGYPH